MSSVSLKNVKKIYPFSGDDIKNNKAKEKKLEKLKKKDPDAYANYLERQEEKAKLQVTEQGVIAVQEFNLEIADKEFVVLVGPSGCGKSTTLRMIAGLEEISEGELYIGDRLVNDVAPKDRDIAMVFQNYALYPHMTVFDNMAFGLKLRKTPKDEINRKPKALSGGQRQRVALGRAIVREPQVFLLDEPLSNLDAKLRAQMRTELSKLHLRLGTTFIYVTHDQTEAMTMGDRIVVMKDGFIQQVDTPQNLYTSPCNMFVAGFIGSPQMNFIDAKLAEKDGKFVVEFGGYSIVVPDDKAATAVDSLKAHVGKDVVLGIRPEDLKDDVSTATSGVIDCNLEVSELMGAETYLYLTFSGLNMTARVSPKNTARPGDLVKMAIDVNKIHLFDKETEKVIIN